MRAAFSGLSPIQQHEKVQDMLASHAMVQVEKFDFENLDAFDEPASLSIHYHIRKGTTDVNAGVLPALWERDYLSTRFIKDRKTPFELIYPFHLKSVTTVKLPSPAQEKALKGLNREGKSDFSKWSITSEAVGNDVTLQFGFMSESGKHSASKYKEFHEDRENARRALLVSLSWDQPDSSQETEK